MSEPVGTKVNLREVFEPWKLKELCLNDVFHFHNDETGDDTWIKVVHAGTHRFTGEIIKAPQTIEEAQADQERLAAEQLAAEGFVPSTIDVTDQVEVIKKPKRKAKDGI